MERVLAEALLSQSQDLRVLLRALCVWESPTPAERVETLRFLLQRLEEEQEGGGVTSSRPAAPLLQEAVREVATGHLVPLLQGLRGSQAGAPAGESSAPRDRRRRVLRAAGGALRSCARLSGGPQLAAGLVHEALLDLLALRPSAGPEEEKEEEARAASGERGGLGAEEAVEVLVAVGPCLRPREDRALLERVARVALAVALGDEDDEEPGVAALVAGRLLPALGRSSAVALRALWDGLLPRPEEEEEPEPGGRGPVPHAPRVARLLLVLSALAERLLPTPGVGGAWGAPEEEVPDAWRCHGFWRAVQAGLVHADGLTRKRARYLLQRAVEASAGLGAECSCRARDANEPSLFWWLDKKKGQLLKFWENYILIMETLEGNQIHVIKPVLPKLNSLFDCAVSEEKACWLLHPSWHMCIYKRMFESENKTLTKEGIMHFLELCETKGLPGAPGFSEFIIGPLMEALSESSLYSRSPEHKTGSCSPLGMKLQTFLVTYVSLLSEDKKSSFLLKFIKKMTSRHWCAVPILFLSRALAHIPPCKVLGVEGLLALRDVLQCTMITHQILLRGAAQCYLLQTAMNLIDVEKVSFSDVSNFLMSLRQEESLGRGTALWTELCDWLRVNENYFGEIPSCIGFSGRCSLRVYVQSLVQDYIKSPTMERGNCFMPDWYEAKLVAMMILLAADVEEMKNKYSERKKTQNELKVVLHPLMDVLMKLGTNAYIPLLKTDKCLQLLLKLLQTCSLKGSLTHDDGVLTVLQNSVMSTAESISEFLVRRLTANELSTVSDLERCHLYLTMLSELVNLHGKVGWKNSDSIWRFISLLKNASILHLQDISSEKEPKLGKQIQKVVSMACLSVVCGILSQQSDLHLDFLDTEILENFISSFHLNQIVRKPHAEEQNSLFEESSSQGWGRVVAQYIHDQWLCLSFLLNKYHTLIPTTEGEMEPFLHVIPKPVGILQSALEALTILPSDQVLPVFHCMKILVPKLLYSSESLCIESFDMAWKIIYSLSNTQLIFWSNLKAFVQFVFDIRVLAVAARIKGQAYSKIKEIIYKIIEMSTTKTGVLNILISYCCRSWIVPTSDDLTLSQDPFSSARDYIELIIEGCIFGTVFRRDQRLIQNVQTFIENLGHGCAANVVTENTNRDDHYVRVCTIKFLCLLDGSNISHKMFIEDLAIKLLDKDELVSRSRTRYYVNSLQHRVKNRVWQTLLVLFPKFDQNFLDQIIDKIFEAGFVNNQASIKYLIEWIIILILHKFPQFLPKFWNCFCYGEEKLKMSVCTFLSVLSHLDIIIQNISEMKPVLKQALTVVLQWCFNHNFSVRLYALLALKKIWAMCKALHVEEFDALTAVIESSLHQVENMHGAGNAKKNWQRIQEHFFFATFHPLKDYSLETIFYTLPRLSELVEDEWITIGKFTKFTDIPIDSAFQWYLSQTELCELKPSDWSQEDIGSNSVEGDSQSEWIDVQKKMIPWKNNVLDLGLDLVFQDRAAKLGKSISRLIVVASLIDKPTNLGGLCRTCEIFGASALVVGSLHYISDKQFQHLSVSAEQWLPLVEVKPLQLVDYLQKKKTEGYTTIGVEQTAKSSDLTEYCFPEKSLLLLGNEREGIPANLIQHLDVCVEIPQHGIIRSLNVHALQRLEDAEKICTGRSSSLGALSTNGRKELQLEVCENEVVIHFYSSSQMCPGGWVGRSSSNSYLQDSPSPNSIKVKNICSIYTLFSRLS
ncbi:probable methyltransferase TARBP1 isoform X3 [Vombatus ursinus]|uniref:probable methyltransferase TARBP1 isoform X3 n=1 Tax=Vombatus ursinus TaxID=29139 RepID=UPI000FFCF2DF|nr:probable methyltransferase TARBP1 isoform X3 [Vombatus ursinus]XP_027726627.1 probable methyltransferase TARBP1 isoform X3 [Vombatus ursinus]